MAAGGVGVGWLCDATAGGRRGRRSGAAAGRDRGDLGGGHLRSARQARSFVSPAGELPVLAAGDFDGDGRAEIAVVGAVNHDGKDDVVIVEQELYVWIQQ